MTWDSIYLCFVPQQLCKLPARPQHRLPATSQELDAQDQSKVQKAYIARVLGSFPTEPVTVDKHLAWDSRSNHAFLMNDDGSLAERQSLGSVPFPSQSQQLQAKESQTGFRLLSVSPDGKTSLVECEPKTGRTHQIRCIFQACVMWLLATDGCSRLLCMLTIAVFSCVALLVSLLLQSLSMVQSLWCSIRCSRQQRRRQASYSHLCSAYGHAHAAFF